MEIELQNFTFIRVRIVCVPIFVKPEEISHKGW